MPEIDTNNVTPLRAPVQNVERAREHLDSMGVTTTWDLHGDAGLTAMQEVFEEAGFPDLAPRQRTTKEALRVALVEKFSKKNRRVAPSEDGYDVTIEHPIPGTRRNSDEHVLSAWIEKDEDGDDVVVCDVEQFVVDGYIYKPADLASWVSNEKARVDSGDIGESIRGVASRLRGLAMREKGGAYWLPSGAIGRWSEFSELMEKATQAVTINIWDTANTARSIKSTVNTISAHVTRRCDEIMTELEKGTLGVRALNTQSDLAVDLVAQLSEYEEALGTGLAELRQKVQEVQIATVQAAMMAQAIADEKKQ